MKAPVSSTSANARSSSETSGAYWALTSTRGIRGTGLGQCRRAFVGEPVVPPRALSFYCSRCPDPSWAPAGPSPAPPTDARAAGSTSSTAPPNERVGREQQNSCNDSDFDIAEVVVEALVARAEAPADTGESEAPERGACEREDRVAREPDAEDARGNRGKRPHDGCDPPDEHSPILVTVEPTLRASEVCRRNVQHTTVALEQRAAAVKADRPAADGPKQVPDGARERDRDVRGKPAPKLCAEDRRARAERTRREGASHHHHELARGREDGIDEHQHEDGVEPVVADERGDRPRQARERHPREATYAR